MRTSWPAAVAVIAFGSVANAQMYVPISVTGYNQGVIAAAGSTPLASTTVPYDGPGDAGDWDNVLYQQGFNTAQPSSGLPTNGTIVASATRSYQLGPASGNNDLQLTAANPTGNLSFVVPQNYARLSILLADGNGSFANGAGALGNLLVNWSNGNSTNTSYRAFDWFPYLENGQISAPAGVASFIGYRVNRANGTIDDYATGAILGPYLLYYDVDLSGDPNYLGGASVDSVTFSWPGSTSPLNGHPEYTNIMAISGSLSVPEPSTFALLGTVGCVAILRRQHVRRLSRRAGSVSDRSLVLSEPNSGRSRSRLSKIKRTPEHSSLLNHNRNVRS